MAGGVTGGFLRGTAGPEGLGPLKTEGSAASGAATTGQVNDPAGVALTPKYAFANIAAGSAAAPLVAGVAGKKIRVLAAVFVAGATATALTFNSAAAAISALFANAANGGATLPFSPVGWFETAAGSGLTVTTGAGSATGISVVYVEV